MEPVGGPQLQAIEQKPERSGTPGFLDHVWKWINSRSDTGPRETPWSWWWTKFSIFAHIEEKKYGPAIEARLEKHMTNATEHCRIIRSELEALQARDPASLSQADSDKIRALQTELDSIETAIHGLQGFHRRVRWLGANPKIIQEHKKQLKVIEKQIESLERRSISSLDFVKVLHGNVKNLELNSIAMNHVIQMLWKTVSQIKENSKGQLLNNLGDGTTEYLSRVNTIELLQKRCAKEIFHLKDAIGRAEGVKKQDLETRLRMLTTLQERCTTSLANWRQTKWIDSSDWRALAKAADVGLLGAVSPGKYGAYVVPVIVNARIHSVKIEPGQAKDRERRYDEFHQSGVITDFRDGTTNLREMKRNHSFDAHIKDRRAVLENQMLQLLDTQVHNWLLRIKEKSEQMKEEYEVPDRFVLSQTSLLEPSGKIEDKGGGFVKNEKNFMLDMAEIFAEFNGRPLVLDKKTDVAYIDPEGSIHLPVPTKGFEKLEAEKKLTLTTSFFNVSVEGKIKNEGAQKEVNDEAFNALKERVNKAQKKSASEKQKILDKIEVCEQKLNRLHKEGGAHDFAVELLTLQEAVSEFEKAGSAKGINCFSGKDRTGEIAKRLVRNSYIEDLEHRGGLLRAEKEQKLAALEPRLSILALENCYENTGWELMKNRGATLQLVGLNPIQRLWMGFKAWLCVQE